MTMKTSTCLLRHYINVYKLNMLLLNLFFYCTLQTTEH